MAHQFGEACWQYAQDLIHAIEWCIMSVLKIPYEWRNLFMTPKDRPNGDEMARPAFITMWKHMCTYVTNRNELYCGLVEEEIVDGAKRRVYKGIDPKALNPMNLASPPLADRPGIVGGAYNPNMDQELAARCLFGNHGGWCDLHTLREYMHLLEQGTAQPPTRTRTDNVETPEEAKQRIALLEAPGGIPEDIATGVQAEGMDTADQ